MTHKILNIIFGSVHFIAFCTTKKSYVQLLSCKLLVFLLLQYNLNFVILQLVTISEYHVKQMQDNMNSSDTDTSTSMSSDNGHQFVQHLCMIYQSKVIFTYLCPGGVKSCDLSHRKPMFYQWS